jgi:hypothetical protein
MSADEKFLTALTAALVDVAKDDPPKTAVFTHAMDKVLPVFEHMGATFCSLSYSTHFQRMCARKSGK